VQNKGMLKDGRINEMEYRNIREMNKRETARNYKPSNLMHAQL
jgi:hypothetical protein